MNKPRIADLFCGAGGAGMGLHQAGFEVVGFDIKPQSNYPFEFHQEDALTVDLRGFNAVWASPPCQKWVDPNSGHDRGHPDLIAPSRDLLLGSGLPYVIENVELAPLLEPFTLCGTMFDLRVIRHRLFETHPHIFGLTPPCNHWGRVSTGEFAAVYGRGGKGPRRGRDANGNKVRDARPLTCGPDPFKAMGIDWMNWKELTQAIPPAYSEWIGRQLMLSMGLTPPTP